MVESERIREIFERYQHKLVRYFRAFGFGEQQAEDFTQDVLVNVLKTEAFFLGEGSLEGWLRAIARRIALDHFRAAKTHKRDAIEVQFEEDRAIHDWKSPAFSGPSEHLESKKAVEEFYRIVDELPDQQRRCVLLRARDFTYKEIAELLDIGVESVRTHLRLARKALRERGAREALRG